MKTKYATISKTGRRSNNEDTFRVVDMPQQDRFMGIVCDGMGGHYCGEVASETVCNAITEYWEKYAATVDCTTKVGLACKKASVAIDSKSDQLGHAQIGTTMVMASIEKDNVHHSPCGRQPLLSAKTGRRTALSDTGPRQT